MDVSYVLHSTCLTARVTQRVTQRVSYSTCYTARVTQHVSYNTCYTARVIQHVLYVQHRLSKQFRGLQLDIFVIVQSLTLFHFYFSPYSLMMS
jgi:hypothetical protein